MRGKATAENDVEAKHLFQLAKAASRGGSHSWHSVDGRELGSPDIKTFDICLLPNESDISKRLLDIDSGGAVSDYLKQDDDFTECDMNEALNAISGLHRMQAVIFGDDLRVSIVLSERNST
jgi:hypothetical protein